VIAVGAGVMWAAQELQPENLNAPRSGPQPAITPETTESPDPVLCNRGPWSEHCPEADWARKVLEEAGFELTGDTGSALVANTDAADLYFWAFERVKEQRPRAQSLREEGYRLFREIDGIAVYSDGVRLTWESWGLLVWVDGGPTSALNDLSEQDIQSLVRASERVAYS
jgi:hypothetical protein